MTSQHLAGTALFGDRADHHAKHPPSYPPQIPAVLRRPVPPPAAALATDGYRCADLITVARAPHWLDARAARTSYTPKEGTEGHDALEAEARRISDAHAVDGRVEHRMRTLAAISPVGRA